MRKPRTGTIVWIIIGLIIISYFVLNNIYTFNKSSNISGYDCENNKIVPQSDYWNNPQRDCNLDCYHGRLKVKGETYCDENNMPTCKCKITIWSKHITPLF